MDKIYKIGASMVQGDFGSIQQTGNAALGRTLAENLDIKLGDKVYATFPNARATDLTVTGIFFTGTPLDERVAFVSLKTARNFRDKGDVINAVEISLQDIAQAEGLAAQISTWGYNALSWQENNPEIMRAINIGGFWTRFSVLLFMVVAFFGVASIMNLLVVEKTREIGMLMAMGASRSNIRDIFLVESAILGFMGAAAGTALGLAGVLLLGNVPFEIAAAGQRDNHSAPHHKPLGDLHARLLGSSFEHSGGRLSGKKSLPARSGHGLAGRLRAEDMFELDIARRHVATNRRGTAFTMISVAIAVGIIIMSLGLTEGVRVQILENTIEKNAHLIINPKKTESYINMYRTLSETTTRLSGRFICLAPAGWPGSRAFPGPCAGSGICGRAPRQRRISSWRVQESMIFGNFSDLIFSKKGAILGVKLAREPQDQARRRLLSLF